MGCVTQRLTHNQTGSLTKEEEAGLQLARHAANVLREGSKSAESTPLPKGLVDKTVEVVWELRMPDEGAVKRKSPLRGDDDEMVQQAGSKSPSPDRSPLGRHRLG